MNNSRAVLTRNIPMIVFSVAIVAMSLWPNIQARLAETRAYRDLAGLTPFTDVTLDYAEVVDGGIIVAGRMRKVRCKFVPNSLVGYVHFDGRPKRRTTVDTSVEDAITGVVGRSRPPSKKSETWGPWKIIWKGDKPKEFTISADHEKCPTPPIEQVNRFIGGEWQNLIKDK